MKIPSVVTAPMVYYTIVKFPHWFGFGSDHTAVYKTRYNAEKAARKLIDSGLYDLVTIRREEVTRRDYNVEISCSGLIQAIWKNDSVKREHDSQYPDLA